MKKYILSALLLITSCTKHDWDPFASTCQITQLNNEYFTATFYYDAKGIPLSIIRTDVATGAPNYLIRHDRFNRITDVINPYSDTSHGAIFENWHRFAYDAHNRIIRDTVYNFGSIGNDPSPRPDGPQLVPYITRFEYDIQNRIKRTYVDDTYFRESRYYYNLTGNLDSVSNRYSDTYTSFQYTTVYGNYDDKVNLRRTNPLWQFLDRDFSRNNAVNTAYYNERGLPTQIDYTNKQNAGFLNFLQGIFNVQYKCR